MAKDKLWFSRDLSGGDRVIRFLAWRSLQKLWRPCSVSQIVTFKGRIWEVSSTKLSQDCPQSPGSHLRKILTLAFTCLLQPPAKAVKFIYTTSLLSVACIRGFAVLAQECAANGTAASPQTDRQPTLSIALQRSAPIHFRNLRPTLGINGAILWKEA